MSGTISYGGSWLCDVFNCSSARARQHARYFQHNHRHFSKSEIESVLKEGLKETMIKEKETFQLRLFKVSLQDNSDVETIMYHRSSEAMNWNSPQNMFVTVIEIKDVQSSIPWHHDTVICAGSRMC